MDTLDLFRYGLKNSSLKYDILIKGGWSPKTYISNTHDK